MQAQSSVALTVAHNFDGSDGGNPSALIQGTDGNFYGTTGSGGVNHDGAVYRLSPDGTLTILHSFDETDGAIPEGGLVLGSDGSFYGMTFEGGANRAGTVFRITAAGTFTSLHSFNGTDGAQPEGGLVEGQDGSFYGMTTYGGSPGDGTVFRITPAGAVTILHTFVGTDGAYPSANLVQVSDDNFYGTTGGSGDYPGGTVFRLTPAGVFTNLHLFAGTSAEGREPTGLALGRDGNFYGTTTYGGANDQGTVFRTTTAGAVTTLHNFDDSDAYGPGSRLLLGSDGNFYGTAASGGSYYEGTVFEVTPAGQVTVLHDFGGSSEGFEPMVGLIQGSDGDLYGTTASGGTDGDGTIFKLAVPDLHPAFFTGEAALSGGVYYLSFPTGNYFGYYSYLTDAHYLYHFDLGYEYVFDAADGHAGVYLYDFESGTFFYTSPTFPFPYLYDFTLNTVLYYYPAPNDAGHYNTDGYRFFYRFDTGQIIVK